MIFKWFIKKLFYNNTPIKEGGYQPNSDAIPLTKPKRGSSMMPITVGYLKNGRETRLAIKDKDKFMENIIKQEITFVCFEGDVLVYYKQVAEDEVEYKQMLHKSRFAYAFTDHDTIWILKNTIGDCNLESISTESELKKFIEDTIFRNKPKTLLIRYRWFFHGMGTLSGETLMRESVWESMQDKEWKTYGELGKHSEVEGEFSCENDFTIKELTDAQLESLADIFDLDLNDLDKEKEFAPAHINITGFNPFYCIKEDIEDEA